MMLDDSPTIPEPFSIHIHQPCLMIFDGNIVIFHSYVKYPEAI